LTGLGCADVYCAYLEDSSLCEGNGPFLSIWHLSIDQEGGIMIIMELQESINKEAKK
ncbi:hypothetical protein HispidOSU_008898, partial [Sigmodon hispidus]